MRNPIAVRALSSCLLLIAAGCVTITPPAVTNDPSNFGAVNGVSTGKGSTPSSSGSSPTPTPSGGATTNPTANPTSSPAGGVTWTQSNQVLPAVVAFTAGTVVSNNFVVVGGTNTNGLQSSVTSYPINANGTLGVGQTQRNYSANGGGTASGICSESLAGAGSNLLVFGGQTDANGSATNIISSTALSGAFFGVWSNQSATLNPGRQDAGIAQDSSRVYLVGGRSGTTQNLVSTDSIQAYAVSSAGTVTANSPLTIGTLPTPRAAVAAAAFNNRLYVFGGSSDLNSGSPTLYSDVTSYPINADGSLGARRSEAAIGLPQAWGAYLFVFNNKLYLLGGMGANGALSGCFVTSINADGTLAGWTATTPIPDRIGAGAAATDGQGHVFLAGGQWEQGQSGGNPATTANIYLGTLQ